MQSQAKAIIHSFGVHHPADLTSVYSQPLEVIRDVESMVALNSFQSYAKVKRQYLAPSLRIKAFQRSRIILVVHNDSAFGQVITCLNCDIVHVEGSPLEIHVDRSLQSVFNTVTHFYAAGVCNGYFLGSQDGSFKYNRIFITMNTVHVVFD
jgi:hypothetical protein